MRGVYGYGSCRSRTVSSFLKSLTVRTAVIMAENGRYGRTVRKTHMLALSLHSCTVVRPRVTYGFRNLTHSDVASEHSPFNAHHRQPQHRLPQHSSAKRKHTRPITRAPVLIAFASGRAKDTGYSFPFTASHFPLASHLLHSPQY